MKNLLHKWLAVALLLTPCSLLAQNKINPNAQVNWVKVTGTGAPTSSCTAINYGQPYLDTSTTPYTKYTCGPSGWAVEGAQDSTARSSASAAQSTANTAQSTASAAQTSASAAQSTASAAQTAAAAAQTTANAALPANGATSTGTGSSNAVGFPGTISVGTTTTGSINGVYDPLTCNYSAIAPPYCGTGTTPSDWINAAIQDCFNKSTRSDGLKVTQSCVININPALSYGLDLGGTVFVNARVKINCNQTRFLYNPTGGVIFDMVYFSSSIHMPEVDGCGLDVDSGAENQGLNPVQNTVVAYAMGGAPWTNTSGSWQPGYSTWIAYKDGAPVASGAPGTMSSTGVVTNSPANHGNGTFTGGDATNAESGIYLATFTGTPSTATTTFSVTSPTGVNLGSGTTGTPFTADGITFTLFAGTTAFWPGDVWTISKNILDVFNQDVGHDMHVNGGSVSGADVVLQQGNNAFTNTLTHLNLYYNHHVINDTFCGFNSGERTNLSDLMINSTLGRAIISNCFFKYALTGGSLDYGNYLGNPRDPSATVPAEVDAAISGGYINVSLSSEHVEQQSGAPFVTHSGEGTATAGLKSIFLLDPSAEIFGMSHGPSDATQQKTSQHCQIYGPVTVWGTTYNVVFIQTTSAVPWSHNQSVVPDTTFSGGATAYTGGCSPLNNQTLTVNPVGVTVTGSTPSISTTAKFKSGTDTWFFAYLPTSINVGTVPGTYGAITTDDTSAATITASATDAPVVLYNPSPAYSVGDYLSGTLTFKGNEPYNRAINLDNAPGAILNLCVTAMQTNTLQANLNGCYFSNLFSPNLTGTPTATTPATTDNSTRIATTALVVNKIAATYYASPLLSYCAGAIGTANATAYYLYPSSGSSNSACTSTTKRAVASAAPGTVTACYVSSTVGGATSSSGVVAFLKETWNGSSGYNETSTPICTLGLHSGAAICSNTSMNVSLGTTNGFPDSWAVSVTTGQASDTTAGVQVVCSYRVSLPQ